MFLSNPYNAKLGISKKDDKIFLDMCKGIPGFKFNGESNKLGKFLKLLKVDLMIVGLERPSWSLLTGQELIVAC